MKTNVKTEFKYPELVYRGSRCGMCYWALYDGDWCQNPACLLRGRSVKGNRLRLTNDEAATLITAIESLRSQGAAGNALGDEISTKPKI